LIDDINSNDPMKGTKRFLNYINKFQFVENKLERHNYEVLFIKKTAHNMHPTFWNGIMLLKKKF